MWIIINSFVVFALTLILTKSKVLAGKREFVEQRYEASKADGGQPGWVHKWWHAMWTCPMCSGFWVAIPICLIYPAFGIFVDIMLVFGINWLIHCVENLLFFTGELAENLSDSEIPELVSEAKDAVQKADKIDLLRTMERNFRKNIDNKK